MSDKKPWDDEPTPLCEAEAVNGDQIWGATRYVPEWVAGKLEQKLRHALKLVISLRIDAMHAAESDNLELDAADVDYALSVIEETLSP
jgi:hypothetical protein